METLTRQQIDTEILALKSFASVTVWWISKDGKTHRVHQMDQKYLTNLWTWLNVRSLTVATAIVECVLHEVYFDTVRYDFLELCKQYAKHPETWRMKVVFNLENAN